MLAGTTPSGTDPGFFLPLQILTKGQVNDRAWLWGWVSGPCSSVASPGSKQLPEAHALGT